MSSSIKQLSLTQQQKAVESQAEQLVKTDVPVFDAKTTYAQLLRLSETKSTRQDFLLSLLQHAVSVAHAQGAAYFVVDETNQLNLGPRLLSRELVHKVPNVMDQIKYLAVECSRKSYSFTAMLDQEEKVEVILSPVSREGQSNEVISLVSIRQSEDRMPWNLFTQLLAGYVNLWEKTNENQLLIQDLAFSGGLIEIVSALNSAKDKDHAFVNLTLQLKEIAGANRVALGIAKRGRSGFDLVQLSDHDEVDARGEFSRLLQLCFDEAENHGEAIRWPYTEDELERNLLGGHKQFCEFTEANSVISVPLSCGEEGTIGIATLWWTDSEPARHVRFQLAAAGEPIGSAIKARISRRDGNYKDLVLGSRTNRSKVLLLVLMGLLMGAMFIPVSHRVKSDVVIEPVSQRIVSTSFDAILERAEVKTGDLVKKDDLLALFDGTELAWELSSLEAEISSAKKIKVRKLAERDTHGAQLAGLEIEKIGLQIDLLKNRIANLEVRSPIDGIVISGDLEQRQGSLLPRGEPIFEVAPLDQVAAEIRVSSVDYRHVDPDNPVEISLEALPKQRWQATLGRIQPRAMVVDAETVFLSRLTLENPEGLIHPGMRGKASIVNGEKPLGWVLFHKAYEQVRLWLRVKFGW